MSIGEIIQVVLGPYGVLVLIILIGIAGARGMWVYGWQYREVRNERNAYRDLVLSANALTEIATDAAVKKTRFDA